MCLGSSTTLRGVREWTPEGDGVVHLGDDGVFHLVPVLMLLLVISLRRIVSSAQSDWRIRYLVEFTFVEK